jgi:flagellar motor switch protein FliG
MAIASTRTASAPRGARRAAILMVLLGEEVAGKMFRHLAPAEIQSIALEVADLGPIESDVAEKVLQDYFVDAVRPTKEQGGLDVARRLLGQASMTPDQVDRVLNGSPKVTIRKLGTLSDAEPGTLARSLADEHPQTIALVLLNLPPARSARVLGALPDAVRPEIVRRMATLRHVRGELLGEVTASLQERLEAVSSDEPDSAVTDGLEGTAAILQCLSRAEARRVLEGLESADPDQALLLRSRIFTFESLVAADDRGIQELLRMIETKTLALALRGAEESTSKKVLANLSERASSILKDEMEFLGAVRPDDQDAARREVVTAALKLEEEGKLVFAEGDADGAARV